MAAVCATLSMLLTRPSMAYLNYIDWRVLVLLFCLMAVVAGVQSCGVFAVLAQRLLAGERSLRLILLTLVLLPFFASMLVTNDVALIAFVPFALLVLGLVGQTKRLIFVVVLQTVAANLGSMATPVGNPQNLYLYASFGLTPSAFFARMLPLTLVSLVLVSVAALATKSHDIRVVFPEPAQIQHKGRLGLLCGLFCLCLLSVFHLLHYIALLAVVVVGLLLFGRDLFRRVDYGLLATFLCFFIFAGNIGGNAAIRGVLDEILGRNTALTALLTSQVISNVPAAMLLSGFTADWQGLLLGVNIGGLGTPIASLASLISLKAYLRMEGARPGRYLAVFTVVNLLFLAVLVAAVILVR